MEFTISPMTAADLTEVLALWSRADGVGLTEGDSPDELGNYLARNPGLSLVAREGQKIVGAVLCGHDGRRGFLYHLAIDPPYRRHGLGQKLVATCLTSLAQIGIQRCTILVFADNHTGQTFWQNKGWAKRDDLLVMQSRTTV